MLLTGLVLFALFFILGASLTQTMPKVLLVATGINQWEYQPREQSVLYYSDGQEMTRLGYKRIYSENFPDFMKQAVVAVEDRRFYEHNGLDTRGIGRAIWNNLRAGSKVEGEHHYATACPYPVFEPGRLILEKLKKFLLPWLLRKIR